jgi:hypothetical protein
LANWEPDCFCRNTEISCEEEKNLFTAKLAFLCLFSSSTESKSEKMEANLNILENGRQPHFKENGRQL